MPARASQRAVHQGWTRINSHTHGASSYVVSLGVATWQRRKSQKSQRCAFRISGLSFGAPFADRLDPWLWPGQEVVQRLVRGDTLLPPWCWVLGAGCWVLQRTGPFDAGPGWARGRRLIEWVDGGRRGAPLRTDRVLHPLASPLICVSDDTQPLLLTLSAFGPYPSSSSHAPPSAPPVTSSAARDLCCGCGSHAGHRPSWRPRRCVSLCTVAKVRAARDIRRACIIRPLSGDPGPLEMGSDFDVHGIGKGTRGWPLMRTSVCLCNKVS